MITLESPTRVTLALDIIRLLEEGPLLGYHELGIVKHQIALADTLYVECLRNRIGRDIVECDDPRVPVDERNICVRACELVRAQFGKSGFLRIVINKKIPVMGGLAGGSANAATMLAALDNMWELGLTRHQFCELGRKLGMDVPFFFTGGTAFDSETTGVIRSIDTNLKLHIVLAIPDFGVSTKEAYSGIDYDNIGSNVWFTEMMISAFVENDFGGAIKSLHNDFEPTVFNNRPRLKEIRDTLISAGCLAACMSGSGSTIIGIAEDSAAATKIAAAVDCQTIVTESYQPLKNLSP